MRCLRLLSMTLTLALAACSAPSSSSSAPKAPSTSSMPFSIERLNETFSGHVAEVITVSGYIYVRVVVDGARDDARWVASLKKHVVVGDHLDVRAFGTAPQFTSRQLDRTFDTLWFGVIKPTPPPSVTTSTATNATTQQEPT
jgi:hypothetical protein